MPLPSLLRLVTLAALWGGSFLFMRMGAPVLGPGLLIELRVALGALFLLVVARLWRQSLGLRQHWRHYLVLGLFNCALPFLLFASAAQTLSASLLSILNATAPLWGALITAGLTRRLPRAQVVAGLLLGIAGVTLLVGLDASALRPGAAAAIAMALAASFSYGIATQWAKQARQVPPFANAHGSLWAATLLVAPSLPFASQAVMPSPAVAAAVLALGVLCSGVAYLLYFRLVVDIGPAQALTVTFLVPVFGVLWGHLVLGEPVGWHTLLGGCTVVAGTVLVSRPARAAATR